jgi:hypothetical protein
MDLIAKRDGEWTSNGRALWLAMAGILLAASIAAAGAIAQRPAGAGSLAGDPFVQPAAIEFRQGERDLSRAPAGDPFVQPAAIEFRRGERLDGR